MIKNNPMHKFSLLGSHVWKRLPKGAKKYHGHKCRYCYVCGGEIEFNIPGTWKYDSPYTTEYAHPDCNVKG